MIVSVSTGIGLQQKIREKIAAFNGHIVISNYDDNQSQVTVDPIHMPKELFVKLEKHSGIVHVQEVATKAALIRTEKEFEGIVFKGVGANYDWSKLEEFLIQGQLPKFDNTVTNEVVISKYLADRLHLKLKSSFNTFFMKEQGKRPSVRKFTIVGIYNSGFQEFDASYVIGDIQHIQRINKWQKNQVGAYEVFVNDFTKMDQITQEVYQQIPPTYNCVSIQEKYTSIFEWLKLFDFNIIVVLIIMIVVATINMVVALLVLILERTQLIGLLKAMGATNWTIRKIFIYNALHLISRGLLYGNGIALLILILQKQFGIVKLNPESYYVAVAPVTINLVHIVLLNLGTILICGIVLLIPSYIITKVTPVRALRFE